MRKLSIALLCLFVSIGIASAQGPQRVRGTITAVDGNVLKVKTAGGSSDIALGDKTEIVFTQPITIGDIKPGDFLGVTSAKGSDGSLTAFEVRRFPKPVNPGHRPFAGRDDQTMTNATVSAMVQSASSRELTLSYEGGTQKIAVSEKAAISMLVPGQRSQLVPGAPVNLTARPRADGKLTAVRIQVSPPSQ
jgi:hypothetical protein